MELISHAPLPFVSMRVEMVNVLLARIWKFGCERSVSPLATSLSFVIEIEI